MVFVFPKGAIPVRVGGAVAVQLKVVPATLDVKVQAVEVPPEQIVCTLLILVTVGAGFTVMVCVPLIPGQPLAVGVMEMVTIPCVVKLFIKVQEGIFPVPDVANPVTDPVVEAVQANVVPLTVDVNATDVVFFPEHSA